MGRISKSVKIWLVVAILGCILFVFACPETALEPSALRALRIATVFFLMLVFPAQVIAGTVSPEFTALWVQPTDDVPHAPTGDLQSLTCTRLC